MSRHKKTAIIALTALGLLAGWAFYWDNTKSQISAADRLHNKNSNSITARKRVRIDNKDEAFKRRAEFKNIKRQWKLLGHGLEKNGAITQEMQKLIEYTAEHLLCSAEAVQLLQFLDDDRRMTVSKLALERAIVNQFSTPNAAKARDILAAHSQNSTGYTKNRYLHQWSHAAGLTCPENYFDSFLSSLVGAGVKQEAQFGRNAARAQTSPLEAVEDTLTLLRSNTGSYKRDGSLQEVIKNLPKDVDYSSVIELFPIYKGERLIRPIDVARRELFRRWARSNHNDAANYVIANSKNVGPMVMGSIAAIVFKRDLGTGVEWVQDLPAGKMYDSAISYAIYYLAESYPEESEQLASRISDESVRRKAFKVIEIQHARVNRREGP